MMIDEVLLLLCDGGLHGEAQKKRKSGCTYVEKLAGKMGVGESGNEY